MNKINTYYPWQAKYWDKICKQINNLPHGMLFVGDSGLGIPEFANLLAHSALCTQKQNNFLPCNTCKDCKLILANNHPDLYNIYPLEKSKIIKVDQIRDLKEKLNTKSFLGRDKIVVIYPAENMNQAAYNALLKSLEEPPGNTSFILVCHKIGSMPATITSRCQKTSFVLQNTDDTIKWLEKQLNNSQNADFLLKISGCAPLKALNLDASKFIAQRDIILKHLISVINNEFNALTYPKELFSLELNQILQIILTITNDLLKIKLGINLSNLTNIDKEEVLIRISKLICQISLVKFSEQVFQAYKNANIQTNLNPQLLIETLLIQWAKIKSER